MLMSVFTTMYIVDHPVAPEHGGRKVCFAYMYSIEDPATPGRGHREEFVLTWIYIYF